MFQAQLLMGGSTIYGPWMERQADNISMTAEAVEISSATFKVELWTKNSEDTGDGSNANATKSIERTTTGRSSLEYVGDLKEWVRYKYTVVGQSTTWVLFRMLDPTWFDDVEA